jgi:TolA-binding protein
MSPRKLKKTLQEGLRAKRNKRRKAALISSLLLIGLIAGGAYLLWNQYRPAALLQQGIRLEQQSDLTNALSKYAQLIERYAASKEAADALYRRGRILQHDLGDAQRALLYYLQLEKDYPQSYLVASAQQQAAELTKYRLDSCEQAIPIYQRLIEQSGADADNHQYEIADCYARLKNWPQAAIEFETLLGSYPQSELHALSGYRLADSWLLSDQPEKARAGYQQVVSDYPQSQIAYEARFRLAELLEEEEHLKEALRAYSALTGYPRQDLLKQKILRLKERIARKAKVL